LVVIQDTRKDPKFSIRFAQGS